MKLGSEVTFIGLNILVVYFQRKSIRQAKNVTSECNEIIMNVIHTYGHKIFEH